jgi:hypothetical protein
MSDPALLKTKTTFGYATVTAVLALIPATFVGLGDLVLLLLLGVALVSLFGWWWVGHCLEVRRVAEGFQRPVQK